MFAKYKLFCPRVHIGNAQLEYVYDAKYLSFMFCENKKNVCDMFRQLPTLNAKSNKIIRTLIDVKLLLIKSYCISFFVDICGQITRFYLSSIIYYSITMQFMQYLLFVVCHNI